jgi:TetR/AcrR family transcriptional regulator, transcriptional repressor for nem operon
MTGSREHILKTAFLLFLKKSYKEVTMKEIVEKTKMSKGAVYHYFPSKENLFSEVINTYYFALVQYDYSRYSQDSLTDFFHEYLNILSGFIEDMKTQLGITDDFNFINYYLIMFDAIYLFPGFKDKITEVHQREREAWEKVIHVAREKGEIKTEMNDTEIAKIFIAISDGIGINAIIYGWLDQIKIELLTLWEKFYYEIKA